MASTCKDHEFERDLVAMIPHMRAFARSLCGDASRADDLAQDAVARAGGRRPAGAPTGPSARARVPAR